MEILKMIALLIGTALVLISCSPADAYALEYQESPFTAGIALSVGDVRLCAVLSVTLQTDTHDRDVKLIFSSPDSLNGITVEKIRGEVAVRLGDMNIKSPQAERWLELADFFNINGTVKDAYITEIDGTEYNCIEALTDTGEEYTVYLNDNGYPRRICGTLGASSAVLDVIWFEVSQ